MVVIFFLSSPVRPLSIFLTSFVGNSNSDPINFLVVGGNASKVGDVLLAVDVDFDRPEDAVFLVFLVFLVFPVVLEFDVCRVVPVRLLFPPPARTPIDR